MQLVMWLVHWHTVGADIRGFKLASNAWLCQAMLAEEVSLHAAVFCLLTSIKSYLFILQHVVHVASACSRCVKPLAA